jgi:hypothetical protein
MADAAPRSFVTSLAGLLTGIAALISAGVAAYNLYKRERPATSQTAEVSVESFEAQPLQVAPGEALVLRWRSEHARTCSLEPVIGAVGANGTRTVKPEADTTYTLRCHGEKGEDERSVSVSVVARAEIGREEPAAQPVVEVPSRSVRESPADAALAGSRDGSPDEWESGVVDQLRRLEDARRESRQVPQYDVQQRSYDTQQRGYDAEQRGYDPEPRGFDPDSAGNVPPQDLAYHCCDMYGNQRCVLVAPVLAGTGCFCPYQGTGISCP